MNIPKLTSDVSSHEAVLKLGFLGVLARVGGHVRQVVAE
jgi:hypothetical protein